uniref:Peroxisomal membrane protein 2 n=1 Tax=Oryctolagus cuniculus TaxID=9986 RepID=G1TEE1_RABIT
AATRWARRRAEGGPSRACVGKDQLSMSPDCVLVHSAILSAFSNFLAQMIEKKRKKDNSQNLDVTGPLRYAIYGFFFTGPVSHFFYLFMESWIPSEVPLAGVKRLLLDRLLFAPAFLLLFFLVMNFLETQYMCITHTYPRVHILWQLYTPPISIHKPMHLRVLFANLVALFWYAYLASLGK